MAEPLIRIHDVSMLRELVASWKRDGLRVALVPTMGALHAGHLSLVRAALEHADRVVASIFVNPTQFGPDEDFESYPRSVDDDCAQLGAAGCHAAFLPSVETMYPPGETTVVDVLGPSRGFEGDERPGHFRGVATVVLKLFNLVQPDVAVFGEKDAQQLALVRSLVRDLLLPVEIVGAPIVREDDGLALSSRNVYLSPDERAAARVLSRSLRDAEDLLRAGEQDVEILRGAVRRRLDAEPLGKTDYVAIVDGTTFAPLEDLATFRGRLVIAIVFRLGKTRLLDNLQIDFPPTLESARLETSPAALTAV